MPPTSLTSAPVGTVACRRSQHCQTIAPRHQISGAAAFSNPIYHPCPLNRQWRSAAARHRSSHQAFPRNSQSCRSATRRSNRQRGAPRRCQLCSADHCLPQQCQYADRHFGPNVTITATSAGAGPALSHPESVSTKLQDKTPAGQGHRCTTSGSVPSWCNYRASHRWEECENRVHIPGPSAMCPGAVRHRHDIRRLRPWKLS